MQSQKCINSTYISKYIGLLTYVRVFHERIPKSENSFVLKRKNWQSTYQVLKYQMHVQKVYRRIIGVVEQCNW